jgi:hypothetical protein
MYSARRPRCHKVPPFSLLFAFTATNLTSPALWNSATNMPFVSGNQWSVTLVTATNVTSFYRLQTQ